MVFQLSPEVIYKKIEDKTWLVHIESGKFYAFSSQTQELLDTFKTPKRIESLSPFLKYLKEEGILEEKKAEEGKALPLPSEELFSQCHLIEEGKENIKDLTFLCP